MIKRASLLIGVAVLDAGSTFSPPTYRYWRRTRTWVADVVLRYVTVGEQVAMHETTIPLTRLRTPARAGSSATRSTDG
jgi:hypothetical protein